MTDLAVLKSQITVGPHWEVVLRPTEFQEDRLPTLSVLWATIASSVVSLRGWDYPHLDSENRSQGNDYIESWVDFKGEREHWRFYQSGMFVHRFAFGEDRAGARNATDLRQRTGMPEGFEPRGYMDVALALRTLAEITEFAARLASKGVFGAAFHLEIRLEKVRDRVLVPPHPLVAWFGFKPARVDVIEFVHESPVQSLVADPVALAVKAAVHLFERFGWMNPSESTFADSIAAYLNRSLARLA